MADRKLSDFVRNRRDKKEEEEAPPERGATPVSRPKRGKLAELTMRAANRRGTPTPSPRPAPSPTPSSWAAPTPPPPAPTPPPWQRDQGPYPEVRIPTSVLQQMAQRASFNLGDTGGTGELAIDLDGSYEPIAKMQSWGDLFRFLGQWMGGQPAREEGGQPAEGVGRLGDIDLPPSLARALRKEEGYGPERDRFFRFGGA